jgi:hypothetical protein
MEDSFSSPDLGCLFGPGVVFIQYSTSAFLCNYTVCHICNCVDIYSFPLFLFNSYHCKIHIILENSRSNSHSDIAFERFVFWDIQPACRFGITGDSQTSFFVSALDSYFYRAHHSHPPTNFHPAEFEKSVSFGA